MEHTRHLDILRPDMFLFPVTLVGCGGIGSMTAMALAKAGCPSLTLIDPDVVLAHNVPTQMFERSDVGQPKVLACKKHIELFSECKVTPLCQNVFDYDALSGVVMSGVDSMEARLRIWRKLRYNAGVPLYIDGRLGGEVIEVFAVQPCRYEDVEFYEKFLYPDDKSADLACTAQNIIYTGFVIAGVIVSQLAHFLRKEEFYRRVNFDLRTMTTVFQERRPT